MTETQINHRKPLAPGEIRSHVVGNRGFLVMHTGNGAFAQASYRDGVDGPTRVLATDRFADVAVRAYADAIAQAESDAVDALDDADGPSFTAAGAFISDTPTVPKSLAELLDAYGEEMARGGIELASGRTIEHGIAAAVAHTTRADAFKAEILGRFGGGR